jgi:hypothetical protein
MDLTSIKNNLESIDYSLKDPKTYLIFVPGLSLVIQKIQVDKILPIDDSLTFQEKDIRGRQFLTICKWSLRSSLFQLVAVAAAVNLFANPLFGLMEIFVCYQLGYTAYLSRTNVTCYEFYPNGNVKSLSSSWAFNLF